MVGKRVNLINVVTSKQVRVEAPLRPTLFLFKVLSAKLTRSEISSQFLTKYPNFDKKWIYEYLNLLLKEKIIKPIEKKPRGMSVDYLAGLGRQLDFFSELDNGKSKYANQRTLKNAKVGILGLGSVSHYIIMPLIASGIGNLKCVDFDIIEKRNITRQPIFRPEDIGKLKSTTVANFVNHVSKDIGAEAINKKLENEKDVMSVVVDCDVVVQSCDLPRFQVHRWINGACLKLNKPNIIVYSGRVGPFSIPYKTACYGCLETALKRKFALYDHLAENVTNGGVEQFPALAVVGALSGTLAAKEIIAHFLGIRPQTYDGFYDINPFQLKANFNKLLIDPSCYACSNSR